MAYTDYLKGGPTNTETQTKDAPEGVSVAFAVFVKGGTDQRHLAVCALGEEAIGITTSKSPDWGGNLGGRVPYGHEGTFTMVAGAAFNRLDANGHLTELASDATGRAIPISTVAISGDHFCNARMAEDSANSTQAGDLITVFFFETPRLFLVSDAY